MADSSGPKRNRTMELNRALSIMGFGTWNNLEPGKIVQLHPKNIWKKYTLWIIQCQQNNPSQMEELNRTTCIIANTV
jgi:hypothetical protein